MAWVYHRLALPAPVLARPARWSGTHRRPALNRSAGMSFPEDAEFLGATSQELRVSGDGAHTFSSLADERPRQLLARLADTSTEHLAHHIYLALEKIRGTFDAAVLSVFLNLPEDALPGESRQLLIGSEALYGLRRASIQHGKNTGEGLTSIMDATRVIGRLVAARSFDPGKIRITIVPQESLPEGVMITIARIVFFTLPTK
jgi:hypothetical protein